MKETCNKNFYRYLLLINCFNLNIASPGIVLLMTITKEMCIPSMQEPLVVGMASGSEMNKKTNRNDTSGCSNTKTSPYIAMRKNWTDHNAPTYLIPFNF